jgi:hypothetical protein
VAQKVHAKTHTQRKWQNAPHYEDTETHKKNSRYIYTYNAMLLHSDKCTGLRLQSAWLTNCTIRDTTKILRSYLWPFICIYLLRSQPQHKTCNIRINSADFSDRMNKNCVGQTSHQRRRRRSKPGQVYIPKRLVCLDLYEILSCVISLLNSDVRICCFCLLSYHILYCDIFCVLYEYCIRQH